MRKTIQFLWFVAQISSAFAQNDLQKCSEEKNREIVSIIEKGKRSDSLSIKKLIKLDEEWKSCVIGKKIPGFYAQTISNEKIDSGNLKDKVVLINFWFTTCPPCVAEIPAFNRLVKEYKNSDVVFIGFAINNKKTLKKFLKKTRFDFKIVPDAGKMEELFGILEHPVTFVVDQSGKVRSAWAGGSAGDKARTEAYLKINPIIDELLKTE